MTQPQHAVIGNKIYESDADLPEIIPVFPLHEALLLPRTHLPLTIFEPRYLDMVDDALASERVIGMIQPSEPSSGSSDPLPPLIPLSGIGTIGRITSYGEVGDGRVMITLTGITRFQVKEELPSLTPYRQLHVDYGVFEQDFTPGFGEDKVDRARVLKMLHAFLDHHGLDVDWDSIKSSSNEELVNALCCMSPYGTREKQALLEARDLITRAETLIAMTEMHLAREGSSDHGQKLQ